jgi:hypothetical protein
VDALRLSTFYLLIRPANSITVIPAKAGIQWRARRADTCFCWIPDQVRNDVVLSRFVH